MKKTSIGVMFALATAAVPVFGQVPAGNNNDEQVRLRLIHAVPNAPNVSVAIGGTELFQEASFKQITPYKVIPKQENQKVTIKLADGRELQTKDEFDFDDDDQAYTILVTPDEAGPNPKVVVLEDDDDAGVRETDDEDESEIKVINASPQHKSVKLQLNDDDVISGVDYARADDEDAKPGSYTLNVLDTDGTNKIIGSQSVTLTAAGSYTVLVMGENDLVIVDDLSPEQPLGGGTSQAAGATTGTQTTPATAPQGIMTTTGTDSMATPATSTMPAMGTTTGTGSM